MKEIKKFFSEENNLNKGYAKVDHKESNSISQNLSKSDVRDQYAEGIDKDELNKMIHFAVRESLKKHNIDQSKHSSGFSKTAYSAINLLSIILIFFASFCFLVSGDRLIAIIFVIAGFSSIILAPLIASFLKKRAKTSLRNQKYDRLEKAKVPSSSSIEFDSSDDYRKKNNYKGRGKFYKKHLNSF